MPKDQEFLEYVVKQIVDKPEEVYIERKIDEMGVLLTLRVDQKDIPRLIGKEGQTAKSLKNLLRTIGYKNNVRATLKIDVPEKEKSIEKHSELN